MEFREINYNDDLEEIVKLIHKNLDAEFTPELFLWKHLENPFGKSYGLLAIDCDKIVGLRMFMFWEFLNPKDQDIIRAIRPVDTVVDEDYRGKGLFKRLTLTGLEECKAEYDLIFNTPNANSLPGYLKMGWQELKEVSNFKISFVNPFQKSVDFQNLEAGSINDHKYPPETISTHKTSSYFSWRYKDPKYKIAYFSKEDIYIAYGATERYLIVYEIFGETDRLSVKLLYSLAKKNNKYFLYYYNKKNLGNLKVLFTLKRTKPVIVLKNFENLSNSMDFSLADLEAVF